MSYNYIWLLKLHTEIVNNYRPSCSGFVCDNAKLRDYIASKADAPTAAQYKENISKIREAKASGNDKGSRHFLESGRILLFKVFLYSQVKLVFYIYIIDIIPKFFINGGSFHHIPTISVGDNFSSTATSKQYLGCLKP